MRVVPDRPADEAARRLRAGAPPVLARIQRDALLLDPRTLADEDFALLALRIADACVDAPRRSG